MFPDPLASLEPIRPIKSTIVSLMRSYAARGLGWEDLYFDLKKKGKCGPRVKAKVRRMFLLVARQK